MYRAGFSILLGLLLAGCGRALPGASFSQYHEAQTMFGTVVEVDVCYAPGQKTVLPAVYQSIWERLNQIEDKISVFRDASEVSAINHSFPQPVRVSDETRQLIEKALRYRQITEGAFDISVGPLVRLWKKAGREGRLPTDEDIASTKAAIGVDVVSLAADGKIQLRHPASSIDLGAFADGYGADEVARILRAHGFSRFLINAGGDMYAGGLNCSGRPWQLGIQHPQKKHGLILKIAVQDRGVATSGDYEDFQEINKQHWSHIIDPRTGYPQQGVTSATVIAPTGIDADALATALCVLPAQQGVALIDSLGPPFAAYIVATGKDGQLQEFYSQRFSWEARAQKRR